MAGPPRSGPKSGARVARDGVLRRSVQLAFFLRARRFRVSRAGPNVNPNPSSGPNPAELARTLVEYGPQLAELGQLRHMGPNSANSRACDDIGADLRAALPPALGPATFRLVESAHCTPTTNSCPTHPREPDALIAGGVVLVVESPRFASRLRHGPSVVRRLGSRSRGIRGGGGLASRHALSLPTAHFEVGVRPRETPRGRAGSAPLTCRRPRCRNDCATGFPTSLRAVSQHAPPLPLGMTPRPYAEPQVGDHRQGLVRASALCLAEAEFSRLQPAPGLDLAAFGPPAHASAAVGAVPPGQPPVGAPGLSSGGAPPPHQPGSVAEAPGKRERRDPSRLSLGVAAGLPFSEVAQGGRAWLARSPEWGPAGRSLDGTGRLSSTQRRKPDFLSRSEPPPLWHSGRRSCISMRRLVEQNPQTPNHSHPT